MRIDYILPQKCLLPSVRQIGTLKHQMGSDHVPLATLFEMSERSACPDEMEGPLPGVSQKAKLKAKLKARQQPYYFPKMENYPPVQLPAFASSIMKNILLSMSQFHTKHQKYYFQNLLSISPSPHTLDKDIFKQIFALYSTQALHAPPSFRNKLHMVPSVTKRTAFRSTSNFSQLWYYNLNIDRSRDSVPRALLTVAGCT